MDIDVNYLFDVNSLFNQHSCLENGIITVLQTPPQARTPEDIEFLQKETQEIAFFKNYIEKGDPDVVRECCVRMKHQYLAKDKVVFHINTTGSKFYLLLEGIVGVYMILNRERRKTQTLSDSNNNSNNNSNTSKSANNNTTQSNTTSYQQQLPQHSISVGSNDLICMKELRAGSGFGELALINNQPRLASIVCHSNCHFATLDKKEFLQILKEKELTKLLTEMGFFTTLPFFQGWNFNPIKQIYLNSVRLQFVKGDYVYKEGSEPIAVYIIAEGEFTMEKHFGRSSQAMESEQPCMSDPSYGQSSVHLISNPKKSSKAFKISVYSSPELFGEEELMGNTIDTTPQNANTPNASISPSPPSPPPLPPRRCSAVCNSAEGHLIMIRKSDFESIILQDQGALNYLAARLAIKDDRFKKKVTAMQQSIDSFSKYIYTDINTNCQGGSSNTVVSSVQLSQNSTLAAQSSSQQQKYYQYSGNPPSTMPSKNSDNTTTSTISPLKGKSSRILFPQQCSSRNTSTNQQNTTCNLSVTEKQAITHLKTILKQGTDLSCLNRNAISNTNKNNNCMVNNNQNERQTVQLQSSQQLSTKPESNNLNRMQTLSQYGGSSTSKPYIPLKSTECISERNNSISISVSPLKKPKEKQQQQFQGNQIQNDDFVKLLQLKLKESRSVAVSARAVTEAQELLSPGKQQADRGIEGQQGQSEGEGSSPVEKIDLYGLNEPIRQRVQQFQHPHYHRASLEDLNNKEPTTSIHTPNHLPPSQLLQRRLIISKSQAEISISSPTSSPSRKASEIFQTHRIVSSQYTNNNSNSNTPIPKLKKLQQSLVILPNNYRLLQPKNHTNDNYDQQSNFTGVSQQANNLLLSQSQSQSQTLLLPPQKEILPQIHNKSARIDDGNTNSHKEVTLQYYLNQQQQQRIQQGRDEQQQINGKKYIHFGHSRHESAPKLTSICLEQVKESYEINNNANNNDNNNAGDIATPSQTISNSNNSPVEGVIIMNRSTQSSQITDNINIANNSDNTHNTATTQETNGDIPSSPSKKSKHFIQQTPLTPSSNQLLQQSSSSSSISEQRISMIIQQSLRNMDPLKKEAYFKSYEQLRNNHKTTTSPSHHQHATVQQQIPQTSLKYSQQPISLPQQQQQQQQQHEHNQSPVLSPSPSAMHLRQSSNSLSQVSSVSQLIPHGSLNKPIIYKFQEEQQNLANMRKDQAKQLSLRQYSIERQQAKGAKQQEFIIASCSKQAMMSQTAKQFDNSTLLGQHELKQQYYQSKISPLLPRIDATGDTSYSPTKIHRKGDSTTLAIDVSPTKRKQYLNTFKSRQYRGSLDNLEYDSSQALTKDQM